MARLKDVCVFYSGTGFPTKYQGNETGEYAFYKVGDIANNVQLGNVYLSVCNNYISGEVAQKINGCILPKDTVVFAKIGEAVKLNRRAITSADCLIDNNAMGLSPLQDKLRLDYFFYFMRNLKMEKLAESTTVPSVRKSILEELEIKVPSISEQEEIGKILDKISSVIQIRKQELRQLDELIKARFVELFGSINDNKYGYDVMTLQDVCEPIKDGTHQTPTYTEDTSNGYKFLSSKDVTSGKVDWNHLKYIPEDLHNELYKRISPRKGDILLAKNGTTGVAAIVDRDEVFDIYVSLALLRPLGMVTSEYLCSAVNSLETKHQFDGSLKGIGVPNLHLGEIKKTKIIVPPMNLQEQFADFVRQVDKSKVVIQKSLDETQLLFDSLMQKYFG